MTPDCDNPYANTGGTPDRLPAAAPDLELKDVPKDVGVMLFSVGLTGFILPGITGIPALLAGGAVLWPETFGKIENWFKRKYPSAHKGGMKQIGRFLTDLDQRYPLPTKAGTPAPGNVP